FRRRLHTAHPVRLGSMHSTIRVGAPSLRWSSSLASVSSSTRKPWAESSDESWEPNSTSASMRVTERTDIRPTSRGKRAKRPAILQSFYGGVNESAAATLGSDGGGDHLQHLTRIEIGGNRVAHPAIAIHGDVIAALLVEEDLAVADHCLGLGFERQVVRIE